MSLVCQAYIENCQVCCRPMSLRLPLGVHERQVVGTRALLERCFRHQLLLPSPYLVLTKPLRLDIQCQRSASVKIGWKYLDD